MKLRTSPCPLKGKAFALVSQASPESQKLMVRNREVVETSMAVGGGGDTGNNRDCKPATQHSHRPPRSLEDTDKGLTHIPRLSLQEADPYQIKTADHKHVDPRPAETERLGDGRNSTLMPTHPRTEHVLIMSPEAPPLHGL